MIAPIVFWVSVALVIYAYAGYPCVLAVLARLRHRDIRKGDATPAVSFIITAHDEERRIGEKIANTLAQDYPDAKLEIIVASDCSTDGTDGIVSTFAPRVRLVRTPQRTGKEAAQGLAVRVASGEVLVFSDVATALAPSAVSTIVRNFSDPTVGCVSSVDRVIDADGRISGEGAYVRYEMWLRALETRVNSVVGLSGSFFAARREVCGQWAEDRQSDFATLLNAVQLGFRGVLDLESVGYYRSITDGRREFHRKVRTVVRGLHVLRMHLSMLSPLHGGLFGWQLASHKVCRWLVPFAMISALCSSAVLGWNSAMYLALFLVQLAFHAAALIGLATGVGMLRIPAFLFVANLAVLVAWMRYARGQRVVAWTPSERNTALPPVHVR